MDEKCGRAELADGPEGRPAAPAGACWSARLVARRDLPRCLRPREKLLSRGPAALTAAELLELVLGSGTRAHPVQRVARRLVGRHGLEGLARLGPRDFRAVGGVGPAGAARLCAVFELARRLAGREERRPRVGSPREVYARVRHLAGARKEHLVGLYLDSQNGLLHQETISIGSLNTTRTHPREILHPAIVHLALGFVLVHNHPSGTLEPSQEDLEFTQSVRRAAELMGLELYDHVIVARGGYTSLRERGLL